MLALQLFDQLDVLRLGGGGCHALVHNFLPGLPFRFTLEAVSDERFEEAFEGW